MQKKFSLFVPLFTASFLPVLTFILYPFGYSVSLFSYEILSAVSAVISIVSVYLIKNIETEKKTRILLAFLPLIQFVNALIYVIKSKSAMTAVFMAACFISCAVISKKIISSDKARIFSVITSSSLFLITVLVSFATVFFGNLSVNTVVDTVESPNGEYYAEIVDSDQGATGGSTVVYIKKTASLNLLILEISKMPEQIYIGEWGEYKTMKTEWKDENTFSIDSTEYNINR